MIGGDNLAVVLGVYGEGVDTETQPFRSGQGP